MLRNLACSLFLTEREPEFYEGLFQADGQWISGTIREAYPQLCVWIANIPPDGTEADSDSHLAQG